MRKGERVNQGERRMDEGEGWVAEGGREGGKGSGKDWIRGRRERNKSERKGEEEGSETHILTYKHNLTQTHTNYKTIIDTLSTTMHSQKSLAEAQ